MVNCAIKRFSPRLRILEVGERYTLAAPIPIKAYSIVQTTGNSHPGGENGGFAMANRNYNVTDFRKKVYI